MKAVLLEMIEDHIRETGISAAAFGTLVMNDPKFVFELREGRSSTLKTFDKVKNAIDEINQKASSKYDVKWIVDRLATTGKSKSGLANALGVNPSAVTSILNGTRDVKAREVSIIESYLHEKQDVSENCVCMSFEGNGARVKIDTVLPRDIALKIMELVDSASTSK